jgi:hypothetical protein
VTDYQSNQVYIMTTTGAISHTLTTDIAGPAAVAFDDSGYGLVVSETTPSIAAFDSNGGFVDYSGAFNNINTPAWISLDQNGDAWIPSTNTADIGEAVLRYAGASGNLKGFSSQTTLGGVQSYGAVVDSSNNIWYASNAITQSTGAPNNENLNLLAPTRNNKGKITGFSSGGSESGTGYNGGGLGIPYKIAIDGGNNVWMANEYYQTVSEYSQSLGKWMGVPGTPAGCNGIQIGALCLGQTIPEVEATGYSNGSTGGTLSATPDNSGNLWTANTDGSVTVLLGAATPTANPIHPSVLGTKP